MASLPSQFPALALHLADQTRTPIISSACEPSSVGGPDGVTEEALPSEPTAAAAAAAAAAEAAIAHLTPTREQRADALDNLADTALRARDAAARLGLGADRPVVTQDSEAAAEADTDPSEAALLAAFGMTPPEHIVVTYNTGAVVIESYLDARQRPPPREEPSSSSLRVPRTAGPQEHSSSPVVTASAAASAAANRAPLLLGLVAAPDAQSLADAQRASARLVRVGRAVQQELVAQQRR